MGWSGSKPAGSVALSVGRSLDDQGERWRSRRSIADWASRVSAVMVSHSGGVAVGGHDRGLGAVAFDDDLVEVAGFRWRRGPQGEVVDDEGRRWWSGAGFRRRRCCQAGGAEPGEQFVGAGEQNGVSAADCVVAQRCCSVFADADGSGDDRVIGCSSRIAGRPDQRAGCGRSAGSPVRSRCPGAWRGRDRLWPRAAQQSRILVGRPRRRAVSPGSRCG